MNIIFVIDLIYLLVFSATPAALICRVVVERRRNHSKNESFYNLIIPKILVNPCLKLVKIRSSTKNIKQSQNKPKQSQFFRGQSLILAKKRGFSTNFVTPFYAKQSQI